MKCSNCLSFHDGKCGMRNDTEVQKDSFCNDHSSNICCEEVYDNVNEVE